MLDSLDALIAFVLIMLVVSLLITIAVQMVSSALNLRGLNLAAGLTEILTATRLPYGHIHGVASLYTAFPPAEARRLAERLEIHHTPKQGSWLNMAEIELSVLTRQCLDERMANQERLTRAVSAWEQVRNTAATRIN